MKQLKNHKGNFNFWALVGFLLEPEIKKIQKKKLENEKNNERIRKINI